MPTFLIISVVVLGFIILYLILKSDLNAMRNTLDNTRTSVSSALADNTHSIHTRLLDATREIGELKREAGAFAEVSRGMRELHDFLRSPKLRGNIGEVVLKDLISQMFPRASYHLQYQFKTGDKVDLIIKTDAGMLPIDSKFPMESFLRLKSADPTDADSLRRSFIRDIKTHVNAIATKYILPTEGTLDFALMYIPSESVFYELVGIDELMTLSRNSRVYPVSPNTLYAALQTILLSFEGRRIESRAREVFRHLRAISTDFAKTQEELTVLGGHLGRAHAKYGDLTTRFTTLNNTLTRTRSLEDNSEDKPLLE